jgi:hypothetical protein
MRNHQVGFRRRQVLRSKIEKITHCAGSILAELNACLSIAKAGRVKSRHHMAMLCQDTFGLFGENDELIKNNPGKFPKYPG